MGCICSGLIRYVWSYIVCVFFLLGSLWGNRGSLEKAERRPRSDRECGEAARLGSGQSCQGMLYMACEVVSVFCLRVYRVCTHPVLSVSSQAGYPVYQADALAATCFLFAPLFGIVKNGLVPNQKMLTALTFLANTGSLGVFVLENAPMGLGF
jgi:hypothetical protein